MEWKSIKMENSGYQPNCLGTNSGLPQTILLLGCSSQRRLEGFHRWQNGPNASPPSLAQCYPKEAWRNHAMRRRLVSTPGRRAASPAHPMQMCPKGWWVLKRFLSVECKPFVTTLRLPQIPPNATKIARVRIAHNSRLTNDWQKWK